MRRTVLRIWKGEAPVARLLLLPLLGSVSFLYRLVLAVREWLYRRRLIAVAQPRIPVVSVGNISLGGTGKTTVVERLSGQLKERGYRPGIVMRGYKKKKTGTFAVDVRSDDASTAGDEATMLARRTALPVIVGRDRARGIEEGIRRFGINIAIFDDGFQLRNVRKDVELLVVNGREPVAGMRIFPLGFLREPLESARKADIILVNKGELADPIAAVTPDMPVFRVRYRPLHLYNLKKRAMVDYHYASGKRVLAFAGLGDNASFFELLGEIGADVVKTVDFPDHHDYRAEDVRRLQACKEAEIVITTEKDAVKMDGFEVGDRFFYLSIEAEIENEEALIDLIVTKTRR